MAYIKMCLKTVLRIKDYIKSNYKSTLAILTIVVVALCYYKWTLRDEIINTRHFIPSERDGGRAIEIFPTSRNCKSEVWTDAPNVTLICRAYSGSVLEFYNIFLVGYNLLWPKQWANSDLVVVLDDDSEVDHRLGTVLVNLPPYPRVFFEKSPREETFCAGQRRVGYSRQQYSNFYSDLYTEKEYIGIVDTDTFFQTPVVPENLFVNGKPRIVGHNACCSMWERASQEATGAEYFVSEFMVTGNFPVMIKREHFKPMREHITRQMKAQTFEEAFHKICTKYLKKYSQFDIMGHYLWFYHRDEYSWHIMDWQQTRHPYFYRRMTNEKDVLNMNRPIENLMKHPHHFFFPDYAFKLISDYYCLVTDNKAGTCERFFSAELREGTFVNWFYEWQFRTVDWKQRQMDNWPTKIPTPENIWRAGNYTYLDIYESHSQKLKKRNYFNAICS